ncbi:hypothetical protein C5F59_008905 [Streptomyces sp. QL37]|uniref:hypothetical protein n=1 Tax=Streptomyces sp. QL37 TaxID=2093747 RepID=UPI000CF1F71B|nr:hypothetical protein [Streptomyces sp. QL37]PPQ56793.1 hypothetical protein C5F59_09000 [Streptomyces sp. QL37]
MTVVAGGPGDAALLVAAEADGTEIRVLCVGEGSKDERAALERALAEASRRGCQVPGGPTFAGRDPDGPGALLRALRELRPGWVRLADPDPERVGYDEGAGAPVHENPDRAAAALEALAAVRAHQLESGTPVFVDCRRAAADEKLDAGSASRYPRTKHWLTEGFDGRLTAFLPSAAGVVRWVQSEPGGADWLGPELLPGPRLMPGLSVVQDPHGFVHLLALRRTARGGGGDDVEIVHAVQYRTGQPLTPWHSLGSPNPGDRYKSREGGFPVMAFDGAGGLFVFARNFGHSVSYRHQSSDGAWAPWRHLSGVRVADELVTVTTGRGEVELLARARDSDAVVRWARSGPGGAWAEDRSVPFTPVPGTMSAGPEPGTVLFRDLVTNEPGIWWPGAAAPLPLGGAEGGGPLTGVRGVDVDGWAYALLVRSGPGGESTVGAYAEGRPDAGVWWSAAGKDTPLPPAAVRSRNGMVTLAVLTAGARLAVAHRKSQKSGLEFDSWYTV